MRVRASGAGGEEGRNADLVSDGIADNVEIQAVIEGAPGGRTMRFNKYASEEWFKRATSYWNSRFEFVEERLISTLRYVELHRDNGDTFSPEFSSILRDAGSTFGSVLDALLRGAAVAPRKKDRGYEFPDYSDFLLAEDQDFSSRTACIRMLFPNSMIVPFEGLEDTNGVPKWWTAHNKVKHQEYDMYPFGNLKNAVNAVCGLAILGNRLGAFVSDSLLVNVGIAYKKDSIDMSEERRLFSTGA